MLNGKTYFQVFVGYHQSNYNRAQEATNKFTNLYVKNIGNMTYDELIELFSVS